MPGKLEEGIKKGLLASLGFIAITREKAQQIAQELIKKGEASSKDIGALANAILEKARKGREAIELKIEEIIKKIIEKMDLPSRKELEELKKEIEKLKKKV